MKSLRTAFKTSPKLETEGVFLEMANARLKLARAGGSNVKFNAAMAKIAEQHKRAIQNGLLSDDKAKKMLYEAYAEHVVLSWETNVGTDDNPEWREGIEGPEDGVLIAVTFDNIVATFAELHDFFLEVKQTAESVQAFREDLIKHIAGN